jgi:hypothetical protein
MFARTTREVLRNVRSASIVAHMMNRTSQRTLAALALSGAILGGTYVAADAADTRSDCAAMVQQADALVSIHTQQLAALSTYDGLPENATAQRDRMATEWHTLTAEYVTELETYRDLRADCR